MSSSDHWCPPRFRCPKAQGRSCLRVPAPPFAEILGQDQTHALFHKSRHAVAGSGHHKSAARTCAGPFGSDTLTTQTTANQRTSSHGITSSSGRKGWLRLSEYSMMERLCSWNAQKPRHWGHQVIEACFFFHVFVAAHPIYNQDDKLSSSSFYIVAEYHQSRLTCENG